MAHELLLLNPSFQVLSTTTAGFALGTGSAVLPYDSATRWTEIQQQVFFLKGNRVYWKVYCRRVL